MCEVHTFHIYLSKQQKRLVSICPLPVTDRSQVLKMSLIIKPIETSPRCNFMTIDSFVHVSREPTASVKWLNRPCFMNAKFAQFAEEIYRLQVRPDDVWVISFPKSGTTWTQEMVWMLVNDLDYTTATSKTLEERFIYLEFSAIVDLPFLGDSIDKVRNAPSPRFIKTHLPAALLPCALWTVRPKLVYVCRNPKDTLVSYWHHYRGMQGWRGELTEFIDMFVNDQVVYAPLNMNVISFWNMRAEENVQFISYEAMKADLAGVLLRMANFFGKHFRQSEMEKLSQHLSVEEMRKNPAVNRAELVQRLGNDFQ